MELRYHAETFQLLGRTPVPRPGAEGLLAQREAACGRSFPASVREWFSLEGAAELFSSSTQVTMPTLDQLGDRARAAQGYLRVASEPRAALDWYVSLGGAEDPAVILVDAEWKGPLASTSLQIQAASFRSFLFDRFAEHRFGGRSAGTYLVARAQAPGQAILAQLRARFAEGPRTDLRYRQIHRFFTRDGWVTAVSADDDLRARIAVWTFDASSPETLFELVRVVWGLPGLRDTLRGEGAPAAAVIARLRQEGAGA